MGRRARQLHLQSEPATITFDDAAIRCARVDQILQRAERRLTEDTTREKPTELPTTDETK